jgi:hypothetical protein
MDYIGIPGFERIFYLLFVFAAFLSFKELILSFEMGCVTGADAVVGFLSFALCPFVFCSACFFMA